MSGLDFSVPAITVARDLAASVNAEIDFHVADVYDAVDVLGAGGYDLVFTGIGALGWLPDVDRWAQVVSELLRPGGRLFLREGHPMLLALADPRPDGLVVVEHPYFTPAEPTVWDEEGTYVTTPVEFTHTVSHEWSHGLGEVVSAVLGAGMVGARQRALERPAGRDGGERRRVADARPARALPVYLHPAGQQAVSADAH